MVLTFLTVRIASPILIHQEKWPFLLGRSRGKSIFKTAEVYLDENTTGRGSVRIPPEPRLADKRAAYFFYIAYFLFTCLSLFAEPEAIDIAKSAPVLVPNSRQYDIVSAISGVSYRVFVAFPEKMSPGVRYPVLYLLDGNWSFQTAAMTLFRGTQSGALPPAIIVGIGYPDDEAMVLLKRRTYDYTDSLKTNSAFPTGGLEIFSRVLLEEIIPFISSRYAIDQSRQSIFGKSLSGLAATYILFHYPSRFQSYVISSPSLWWNYYSVLKNEPLLADWAKTTPEPIRILILSAEREQEEGGFAGAGRIPNIINDAKDLASRLDRYAPGYFTVRYYIFPEEFHWSVTDAAISRAVRFSFSSE